MLTGILAVNGVILDGLGGTLIREGLGGTLIREGLGGTVIREGLGGTVIREGLGGTLIREGLGGTVTREGLGGTVTREGLGGTVTREGLDKVLGDKLTLELGSVVIRGDNRLSSVGNILTRDGLEGNGIIDELMGRDVVRRADGDTVGTAELIREELGVRVGISTRVTSTSLVGVLVILANVGDGVTTR